MQVSVIMVSVCVCVCCFIDTKPPGLETDHVRYTIAHAIRVGVNHRA